jgi:hypothetical protein
MLGRGIAVAASWHAAAPGNRPRDRLRRLGRIPITAGASRDDRQVSWTSRGKKARVEHFLSVIHVRPGLFEDARKKTPAEEEPGQRPRKRAEEELLRWRQVRKLRPLIEFALRLAPSLRLQARREPHCLGLEVGGLLDPRAPQSPRWVDPTGGPCRKFWHWVVALVPLVTRDSSSPLVAGGV